MIQEGENVFSGTGFHITKHALVTILVCTGLSMLFMRTGPLSLLYFAPLGYAVIVSGSFWFTFFIACASYIFLNLVFSHSYSGNSGVLMEIFYFSAMLLCYIWIMGAKNMRTTYRFILASAAGTVAFLIILNRLDSFLNVTLYELLEGFSVNISAAEMVEVIKNIFLRGGAFVSICFMFFVNRQIALGAVWLIRKERNYQPLTAFFAPPNTIWILSGALVTILLTRTSSFEILEIISWNILVICIILFLAQGISVFLFLISRRTAVFRTAVLVVVIFVLFSPLSVIALFALLLLGIVENWRPLRHGVKRADEKN